MLGVDAPGAFEVVLRAYDLIENGGSIEEVERTLAELHAFDPDNEVIPELEWKRVDLLVQELQTGTRSGELAS